MDKKLFIHIGTGKTGTSAIQEYLSVNDEIMENKFSIKYIQTFRDDNAHHRLCFNSYSSSLRATHEKVSDGLDLLISEISKSNCKTFIISSENFPGVSADDIKWYKNKLSSHVDIHIIIYLRRQDEYLESWYGQIQKTGQYNYEINTLKAEMKKKRIFDYFHLLQKWENYIGKNNIHVRVYEKQQFHNGNLFNDFFKVFNIEDLSGFTPLEKHVNPSLTRDQIMLLKAFKNSDQERFIDGVISKPFDFKPTNSRYFLSPAERAEIIKEFDQINSFVATKYLQRDSGELFFDELPINELWKEVTEPSTEYLLRTFIHLLTKQQIHFSKEIEALKKQLQEFDSK